MPLPSRTSATSQHPEFDSEQLRTYINKLLSSTLTNKTWPEIKEREIVKTWIREIGQRVKERMLQMQPGGLKYVVLTQINENRGQGGMSDIYCHWEDSDVLTKEMYINDSLICICVALAIA